MHTFAARPVNGEAVACDDNGVASFDLVRCHRHNDRAFLYAFDLIELNGDDMRRDPLEVRKATLRSMLAKTGLGLRFNEHLEGDGPTSFAHAGDVLVVPRLDRLARSMTPALPRASEKSWPIANREPQKSTGRRPKMQPLPGLAASSTRNR